MQWLKSLPILLLLTLSSAACQTEVSKAVCPTIRSYSQADLNKALSEYRALPADSELKLMFGDYKTLRDQVRVCRA